MRALTATGSWLSQTTIVAQDAARLKNHWRGRRPHGEQRQLVVGGAFEEDDENVENVSASNV
ncbi:MAG: hypothetical protein ACRYGR_06000 [Janthinobacterium lividum]